MDFFKKYRAKKDLERKIQIEILETLATICLEMSRSPYHSRYAHIFNDHFNVLKMYSEVLRKHCE